MFTKQPNSPYIVLFQRKLSGEVGFFDGFYNKKQANKFCSDFPGTWLDIDGKVRSPQLECSWFKIMKTEK